MIQDAYRPAPEAEVDFFDEAPPVPKAGPETKTKRRGGGRCPINAMTVRSRTLMKRAAIVGLTGMLLAGGGLALAQNASAADEAEAPATEAAAKDAAMDKAEPETAKLKKPAKARFSLNAGELAVLKQLAERRRQIDEREARLVERERVAAVMESRLADQAKEMKRLQAVLARQSAEIEAAKQADMGADKARLTQACEGI